MADLGPLLWRRFSRPAGRRDAAIRKRRSAGRSLVRSSITAPGRTGGSWGFSLPVDDALEAVGLVTRKTTLPIESGPRCFALRPAGTSPTVRPRMTTAPGGLRPPVVPAILLPFAGYSTRPNSGQSWPGFGETWAISQMGSRANCVWRNRARVGFPCIHRAGAQTCMRSFERQHGRPFTRQPACSSLFADFAVCVCVRCSLKAPVLLHSSAGRRTGQVL